MDMTFKINGYELEVPDDCTVTICDKKVKVERPASPPARKGLDLDKLRDLIDKMPLQPR